MLPRFAEKKGRGGVLPRPPRDQIFSTLKAFDVTTLPSTEISTL
jgi:hypothetical protein